ncbi:MAG: plasmid partitioning protein RepB C-terminal domain-containing protein [Pseudomonadota bacterium]
MKPDKKKIDTLSNGGITLGFDSDMIELRLEQIVPIKVMGNALQNSGKYKQILSSIKEVGVIEPPVVVPDGKKKQCFILLDGHLRIEALKEIGSSHVVCLISSDDEAFTYNKHINRISPIQEHRMIRRAIERGVPEEKIAKTLNLDIKSIIMKRKLLDGICQEAADMLKDKMVANGVFPALKRMKAYRQIEAVTLMNDTGTYSVSYAKALLAATPKDQLSQPEKPKRIKGLTTEQMARMESEMGTVQSEYRIIEENYGTDVLNLTLAKGYLGSLLGNARVVRYLAKHHPEILSEFQKVTEITSLAGGETT